jgi:hypothetical protein
MHLTSRRGKTTGSAHNIQPDSYDISSIIRPWKVVPDHRSITTPDSHFKAQTRFPGVLICQEEQVLIENCRCIWLWKHRAKVLSESFHHSVASTDMYYLPEQVPEQLKHAELSNLKWSWYEIEVLFEQIPISSLYLYKKCLYKNRRFAAILCPLVKSTQNHEVYYDSFSTLYGQIGCVFLFQ